MRLIDANSLKAHIAASVLDGNQEHKDRASALIRAIDSMPTAYDVDKVVNRLENCPDSTTFRYDKKTGVLYEVEADVWARIADGAEVEIQINPGGIECNR